jgi:hypothetical protein
MRKGVLIIGFILVLSVLPGCIVSHSPQDLQQTMHVGDSITFSIVVFQSQYQIKWRMDWKEIPATYGMTSYTYTPTITDVGSHTLLVVENSVATGLFPVRWKITVIP